MTARKVISVDVEDSSFKRFAAAFAAFGEAVKDSLSDVHALNRAQADTAKDGVAGSEAETKAIEKKSAARKKETKEEQADRKTAAAEQKKKDDLERKNAAARKKDHEEVIKSTKEIAKWSADVAWSTGKAALNVGKWAVLGGLASGFGLGGLALGASNARRRSQGLGIDSGELRAASVNFGKYVDTDSMLDSIANAQSSYGKANLFNRLGINAVGKDPAALMTEMLPRLVQAFQSVGGKEEGANALGLTEFASMDELRALSSLTREELTKTIDAYAADREKLHVDDNSNRDWQSFLVSLKRAGEVVETSLIKHLAVLAPKLENFAQAVSKGIDSFLANVDLEKWINKLGVALQKTATYLASDEFQTDIMTFLHAIHSMAKFLAKLFPGDGPAANPNDSVANEVSQGVYGESTDSIEKAWADVDARNAKKKRVSGLEKFYGLPSGSLDAIWKIESNRGANAGVSSAGAAGDFQIMPGVAGSYGVKDRYDFNNASDGAARMLRDLLKHYSGDVRKALAGYNWGVENLDKDIAKNGAEWQRHLPLETQRYLEQAQGMRVVVENNTGGNAVTTVATLQQ